MCPGSSCDRRMESDNKNVWFWYVRHVYRFKLSVPSGPMARFGFCKVEIGTAARWYKCREILTALTSAGDVVILSA